MSYLRKTEKVIKNINKVFLKTHEWIGKKNRYASICEKKKKKKEKKKKKKGGRKKMNSHP